LTNTKQIGDDLSTKPQLLTRNIITFWFLWNYPIVNKLLSQEINLKNY